MSFRSLSTLTILLGATSLAQADLITAVPGPDDQGGMLMPMVTLQATAGTGSNPTAGIVQVSFTPSTPRLQNLETWSPGAWFDADAAWRTDLGSPAGVGGTPEANAGAGDLFNNQYGFMFMSMNSMMMAGVPAGKSLAIRLAAISSPALDSYNYSASANRWDPVFAEVGDQVLWNGSMWHNYFTLPANAEPVIYTATFDIFVATTPFTGGTGFAQYNLAALQAQIDPAFTPATVTYSWSVAAVPEPAAAASWIGACAWLASSARRSRRTRAC